MLQKNYFSYKWLKECSNWNGLIDFTFHFLFIIPPIRWSRPTLQLTDQGFHIIAEAKQFIRRRITIYNS
jgi:hypothetical protein